MDDASDGGASLASSAFEVDDAALEDVYEHLSDAHTAARLDTETLLKEARVTARAQFRARAVAKKAHEALASVHAEGSLLYGLHVGAGGAQRAPGAVRN